MADFLALDVVHATIAAPSHGENCNFLSLAFPDNGKDDVYSLEGYAPFTPSDNKGYKFSLDVSAAVARKGRELTTHLKTQPSVLASHDRYPLKDFAPSSGRTTRGSGSRI